MKQVYVRLAKDEELPLMAKWLYEGRAKNRFDPQIFLKKQVRIYVAFNETGILGFIPVAAVYLVESLSFRPDVTKVEEAKSLEAFQKVLVNEAFAHNVPDAFFCTYDEDVQKFVQHYDWKPVTVPFFNLHFDDLQKPEKE